MFRSQEKGNKMEDEEALQNAEDWAVGYAEFVSSWVASGGWAGDAAQAWREYWEVPADAEEWVQEAVAEAAAPQGGEVWW